MFYSSFSIVALLSALALADSSATKSSDASGQGNQYDQYGLEQQRSPNEVYVESLVYGGSGCPQNTMATSFNQDRTVFTLIFDQFVASSGNGATIRDQRKNCQVNVGLRVPQGWSYSVISVDYRGYVSLPYGVTATQKATYYFSGEQRQIDSQTTFNGPYDDDYISSDQIGVAGQIWSPCGTSVGFNVNAQVRLSGDVAALNQGAMITVDSTDGKVKQLYGFKWRAC